MKTKTMWTGNIDDVLNAPIEDWSDRAEKVLKECAEFLGNDYEAEKNDRETRRVDKFVIDIIQGIRPMGHLDNFDWVAGLGRLNQAGKIKRTKKGWRVKK